MKNARIALVLALACACGDDGNTSGSSATGTGSSTTTTTASTGEVTTGDTTTTTTAGTGSATGTGEPTTAATTGEPATTGSTTAVSSDSSTDASTGTPDTSTGTPDTSTGTPDTSTGTTEAGTTEAGGDPLAITFSDVLLYSNCQPIIDPDPIIGQWTVAFDNTAGAAEATADLVSATLIISPLAMPSMHPLDVTPKSSGPVPAGQVVMQQQMKSQTPGIPGCASCNQPYKLVLVYTSAGDEIEVVHEANLDCVF